MEGNVQLRSSYIENGYGLVFEKTVEIFLPHKCVEIGVLDGYSLFHIAKGAANARKFSNHTPTIDAYDLWEDYEYKHGSMVAVQKMLDDNKLGEFVNLHKKNAFKVHEDYDQNSVCFLHVDISNDGDVLREIVNRWDDKLSFGGLFFFEGGSEERDNIEWMKKYGKFPIRDEILSNPILNKKYIYATYNAFPSLSVFLKHS